MDPTFYLACDHLFMLRLKLIHVSKRGPGNVYIRPWTGSCLAQAMACRMFGAKPLHELMMTYCQFTPEGHIRMGNCLKCKQFQWRQNFENVFGLLGTNFSWIPITMWTEIYIWKCHKNTAAVFARNVSIIYFHRNEAPILKGLFCFRFPLKARWALMKGW